MKIRVSNAAVVLLVVLVSWVMNDCRSPDQRRRDAARLDSLRADSLRVVNNPYKLGQGNDQYNRQRESLGNLDSLVTPQQPTIPNR